jgi:hypothetical protein
LLARQSLDEASDLLVARGDWLWAMDELMDAWRAAETDAGRAYYAWLRSGGAKAYVVYRAEQDRADAAQDALAEWAATEPSVRGRQRPSISGRAGDKPGHVPKRHRKRHR